MQFASPLLWADSYVHRLDPVVVRLGGDFAIRWYGLAYLAGFLLGWLVMRWMARTKRTPLSVEQVGDLATGCILGILIGGRIGHAVFYDHPLLWTFRSSFPYWDLLAIHRGGMSSHGGIIGVIVACWWLGRRMRVSAWHLLDLIAFVSPIGLGLGRLANFVNGELWGRPIPASMWADPPWWSIKYPEEVLTPAFGSGTEKGSQLDALEILVDPASRFPDSLVEAARRGQQDVLEALSPMLTPHWPSQLFQALTDGVLLAVLLVIVWWKPRKPGVVSAWFLIGYGAMRMLTEQFRAPDEGVLWLGPLTLPMVLSANMIAAGVILLILHLRASRAPLGGIGPRHAAA